MDRPKRFLSQLPIHIVLIGLCLIWIIPALGLLVTSIRPFQVVDNSGWWTALAAPTGSSEYAQYCAGCHGADGKSISAANLTDPALISKYRRSISLTAALKKTFNGQPN